MPTAARGPCSISQATARRYPATVVGNSRSVTGWPMSVMTATWMVSLCESTPPTRTCWFVMMVMPFRSRWVGAGRIGQTGHTPGPFDGPGSY